MGLSTGEFYKEIVQKYTEIVEVSSEEIGEKNTTLLKNIAAASYVNQFRPYAGTVRQVIYDTFGFDLQTNKKISQEIASTIVELIKKDNPSRIVRLDVNNEGGSKVRYGA